MRQLTCGLFLALGIASAAVAQPSSASRKAFDSLFGDQLKAVKTTADRSDDVEFAKRLVETAAGTEDAPGLVEIMCNTAYDLSATQPSGYATAAQAMRLLIEKAPMQAIDAPDRLVEVLRRQMGRSTGEERAQVAEQMVDALLVLADRAERGGDYNEALKSVRQAVFIADSAKSPRAADIKLRQEMAQARVTVDGQLKRAQAKVKASASDQAAHAELGKLYLVELNDPAKAKPHAESSGDDALRSATALAAKPVAQLTDKQCHELGEWMRAAGASATVLGKVNAYARARDCYARYLKTTKATGLEPATAKLSLDEVEKALAALTPKAPTARAGGDNKTEKTKVTVMEKLANIKPEDGWVEVMNVIDAARAHRGQWTMKDDKLTCTHSGNNTAFLDVPFDVRGISYEMEFIVTRGNSSSAAVFLHLGRGVTFLHLGDGPTGDRSGLQGINGLPFWQNGTENKAFTFNQGKAYTVRISVKVDGDQVHLQSTVDGKPLVEWKGADTALTTPTYPKLGLSGNGTTIYQKIRIRAVNGEIPAQVDRR